MENTLQLQMNLKMSRIADLLCSGFEGGIGYWARIEKYKEPSEPIDRSVLGPSWDGEVYPYIHYPLTPDGAVIIKDTEDDKGKKYTLDMKAIKKGLAIFQEKYPSHFGNWLSEDDDAITGDVFIQCCLLGEIVYG